MFQVTFICSSTVLKIGPLLQDVPLEVPPYLTWCVETGPPPWPLVPYVELGSCSRFPMVSWSDLPFPFFLYKTTEEFLVILKEFGGIDLFSLNRILDSLLSPTSSPGINVVHIKRILLYAPKVFFYVSPKRRNAFANFWEEADFSPNVSLL